MRKAGSRIKTQKDAKSRIRIRSKRNEVIIPTESSDAGDRSDRKAALESNATSVAGQLEEARGDALDEGGGALEDFGAGLAVEGELGQFLCLVAF